MIENILNRIRSATTAIGNRVRAAIPKWAGTAAAKDISKAKADCYRKLASARGRVHLAEKALQSANELLAVAKAKLDAHCGGCSAAVGLMWSGLGVTALFGEGVLNRNSLPYILSIDLASIEGWVLPVSATLGPILLHPVFEIISGSNGRLVRSIPVVIGAGLALGFVLLFADPRGAALAILLDPSKTETGVSPELINRAIKLLSVGLGWWAGTFFFLASGNFRGRSLNRAVAGQEQAQVNADQELTAARVDLDIAEYAYARIEQTAREEAEAALAQVPVEIALRDSSVGRAEDEVNRRLAEQFNEKLLEMPTPELPDNSRPPDSGEGDREGLEMPTPELPDNSEWRKTA